VFLGVIHFFAINRAGQKRREAKTIENFSPNNLVFQSPSLLLRRLGGKFKMKKRIQQKNIAKKTFSDYKMKVKFLT